MASPVTLYEAMGGEETIRTLVASFYWRMQDSTAYRHLRELHPQDLGNAEDRLFKYLSGWTGGPQLFVQAYGHPRLRARHLHVAVDRLARDQWLACMAEALAETVTEPALRAVLMEALAPLADHMRNVDEPPG